MDQTVVSNATLLESPLAPDITEDETLDFDIQECIKKSGEKSSDAEQQTVSNIMALWSNWRTMWNEYFQNVYKNFKYLRNDQLSKNVRDKLREDNRMEVEFNFLLGLIVYICGVIAKNKTKVKATPARRGDEDKSSLHTVITQWAQNGCDGDYEMAIAGRYAVIAGIGWTANFWSVTLNKWITKAVSPFKVMFNPNAQSKEDQADWLGMTYDDDFTAEQIISIYNLQGTEADNIRKRARDLEGQFKKTDKPMGMLDRFMQGTLNFFDPYGQELKARQDGLDVWADLQAGLYRTVEFYDRRIFTTRTLFNPYTGEQLEIPLPVMQDADLLARVMVRYKDWLPKDVQNHEIWVTAICPKLCPSTILLEKKIPVQGAGFPIKPVFCYDFDPSVTNSKSILSNLISVQDYINQRLISEINWIMQAVNPDWVVEKNSIDVKDLPTWQSKMRGKIKEYVAGKNKPEREHPLSEAGQALANTAQRAIELIPQLSSISPNQRGMAENSTESGVLYSQRVQTGLVTLEHLFSHIQRHQEQVFKYCDKNLQTFMTAPMIVRIAGEPPEGMEGVDQKTADGYWLRINEKVVGGYLNDLSEGDYDYEADPTQLGATAKQAVFMQDLELLTRAAGVDPQQAQVILPLVVGESDSPNAKEMQKRMEAVLQMRMGQQQQNEQMAALAKQHALAEQQKQLTAPEPAQLAA